MTLKTVQEYYPIKDTIVGHYNMLDEFMCSSVNELSDMDNWFWAPFPAIQDGFFNFVRYMGAHRFEIWSFTYERVAGYLSLGDSDDFLPMTYSEDDGWEEVHPELQDEEQMVFAPDEFGEKPDVEVVAAAFDADSYEHDYIFTSKEQLIDFVKSGKF